MFTEPASFPLAVKEQLLRFLFEEIQITRLCLLPKPLAVSYLFDAETCIVVDSGATNTSVAVAWTRPGPGQPRFNCSAANRLTSGVVQSQRRPLLGPSPG